MFNRLSQAGRLATRYGKTGASVPAFIDIAASRISLKHYVNGP